jgi:trigger factor
MHATVEDLSSVKKKICVEIPVDQVARELDKAYGEIGKTAKVKGFRPGKIPRNVLEGLYGKDVKNDVRARLVQQTFVAAIQDHKIDLVGTPDIDPPDLEPKAAFRYEVTVDVFPEIADVDFKGIALKRTRYQPSDMEVDTQLKMLQQKLAETVKIDEQRPVVEGDFVLVDYEGFKDGKPFEHAARTENFTLKIGAGTISKQFDDQLLGASAGETREFPVSFAQDHFNKHLAGQTLDFTVTLKEIRKEVLPAIDDEMAKKLGTFQSLEALKAAIHQNLETSYAKRSQQELQEQVFEALFAKSEFEIPQTLIDYELEGILRDAEMSFSYHNTSAEQLGLTRQKMSETYRPTAEAQARRHLLLNKIVQQEKLELPPGALDAELTRMGQSYGQSLDEVKAHFAKGDNARQLDYLKEGLLEKMALELIIRSSTIEDVDPEPVKDATSEIVADGVPKTE